jgi:phosphoglycerate dehydrogenase-like enzyme
MKAHKPLLSTSGEVSWFDKPILIRALPERWIAGGGLDVLEAEPLPIDDPLLSVDNVILTPDWLASTNQAAEATASRMAEGMLNAVRGREPENVLNRAVLSRPGFLEKLGRSA